MPRALPEAGRRIARSLSELGFGGARVAVVLGSGLDGFAGRLEGTREVAFSEVEGMPRSSVPGHAGKFVSGSIGGERVLVQAGRIHLYEGWSAAAIGGSIRALAELGCGALILTNAAGGLRPEWKPPTLMRLTDHIDRQGRARFGAGACGRGSPYDSGLGEALDRAAAASELRLVRGVYAGLLGPAYETPAEIRMLAWMGADAVGMSTVCEAQVARACGLRVAAVSCITNLAAGLGPGALSHEEVLRAGAAATGPLVTLLRRAVPEIARA